MCKRRAAGKRALFLWNDIDLQVPIEFTPNPAQSVMLD
jgi:hypothetical protein